MDEEPSETSGPMPLMDKLSIAAGILFVCVGLYIAISFIHSRSALQHQPPQPAPGAQAKP